MLIDTHCHIHDPQYNFDAKTTLARAHAAGVNKIVVIGTFPEDNLIAQQFAESHDDVYWSYGAHPWEYARAGGEEIDFLEHRVSPVKNNIITGESEGELARMTPLRTIRSHDEDLATRPVTTGPRSVSAKGLSRKLVAIGEIGLDYHYQPYDRGQQIKLFEQMLQLVEKHDLPVIFHVRKAFDDFWPIVDNAKIKHAVLHSFSDNQSNLNQAIKRGLYIGVNGLVTFTNVPLPPLESMILETDAPYLTPKPFRGKINEPSYVKNIAEWVADKLNVPFSTVATQTTANATKLFNL